MVRKTFRYFVEYFVVFVGLIFIFVIGAIYALLRPEGLLIKGIFFIILVGWVIYQIKYFWDLLDKKKKNKDEMEKDEEILPNLHTKKDLSEKQKT